jgi:AraC-like DNA-binding protein
VVIDNLHAHFNMIVAPINKLILSVDSKNDIANEINTIKIHSRSILEIAQNKNNENFLDVSKQKIEVVSFARNICESFLGLAKNKNIKLEFSSNLVVFECELEQTIVEKILFNLILNSLNDSNQYEKVRLRIDIDELSKTICIELEDYGDGISEDEINSILSDDLNVETSSVGVGLNFIKYLAKKVHGEFNVESELKKGSLITVIIPFYLKAYDAPNILPQIEIVDMERKVSNEVIQEEINISEDIQEYNENVSSVQVEVIDKNFELFIANATKLVHENISDPDLDVEVFCKGLGVSRAQLYRKFKSYKQLTVKEFVKEIRLIKAGELLINSSMNVNEIMNDVGFQNRQYFAKCFKEYFNETPSSYKAKMKT